MSSAGIDLAIGEKEMIGLGIGPNVIREFLDQVVFRYPTITAVTTDPEEINLSSRRAFEKAGFGTVRTV